MSSAVAEDDAALNRRAAAGDAQAFSQLVARHERRLRDFLRRVAGPGRSDDLAQDCFLLAWRRAAQFDGRGSYAGWLIRIGWRLFLDEQRRHSSETRKRDGAALLAEATAEPGHAARLDITAVLARLAPVERAALVLCDGQGWTHEDAAAMLGLRLGTLKSIAARAKRNARALLDAQSKEQP